MLRAPAGSGRVYAIASGWGGAAVLDRPLHCEPANRGGDRGGAGDAGGDEYLDSGRVQGCAGGPAGAKAEAARGAG